MELTKEILQQRKQGIGGSDCGAILGLSKFRTPLEVYLEKVSDEAANQDISEELQSIFEQGHDAEPRIIKRYEKRTGSKCLEEPNLLKNAKYPWMLANIDGWVTDKPVILEAKTVKWFDKKDWGCDGTDEVPDSYLLQCAHYCIVCDSIKKISHVDLAALCRSTGSLRIYVYERNKELEESIIDKTHDFWANHVQKRIPPEASNAEDLKKLYTEVLSGNPIEATTEAAMLIDDLVKIKRNLKPLEEQKKEVEEHIKLFMKDCGILVDSAGNQLVTWKEAKKAELLDSKRLRVEAPDIYEKYLKPPKKEPTRKFLLKEKT